MRQGGTMADMTAFGLLTSELHAHANDLMKDPEGRRRLQEMYERRPIPSFLEMVRELGLDTYMTDLEKSYLEHMSAHEVRTIQDVTLEALRQKDPELVLAGECAKAEKSRGAGSRATGDPPAAPAINIVAATVDGKSAIGIQPA